MDIDLCCNACSDAGKGSTCLSCDSLICTHDDFYNDKDEICVHNVHNHECRICDYDTYYVYIISPLKGCSRAECGVYLCGECIQKIERVRYLCIHCWETRRQHSLKLAQCHKEILDAEEIRQRDIKYRQRNLKNHQMKFAKVIETLDLRPGCKLAIAAENHFNSMCIVQNLN